MDLDQTQAISIDYDDDDDDDETDDETSEVEKKPTGQHIPQRLMNQFGPLVGTENGPMECSYVMTNVVTNPEANQIQRFTQIFRPGLLAFLKLPCQKGVPEKLYPLFEGDNTIGRQESCNICIPVKALSKQHACVEIRGESHLIYDKESRNKSRRGKLFLSPNVRYELKHDDPLMFADVHCTYQFNKEIHEVSGSETGSESILPVPMTKATTNGGSCHDPPPESTLMEDEDEGSDDSVDLLQPTQAYSTDVPTFGMKKTVTASFLFPDETEDEDGPKNKNISVEDTPFVYKKTKNISTVVLPESESEADNSIITHGPPATLVFEDEKDTSAEADLLGAPTQAFLAESDLESEEDEDNTKRNTLLNAATQMYADLPSDSDDEEDKEALNAETQAFVEASDSDSPLKTHRKVKDVAMDSCTPTQPYTVETGDTGKKKISKVIKSGQESTVAYNMGIESDKTTSLRSDKGNGGLEDPLVMETQVFEEEEDSAEQNDMSHLFTTSTLACEMPCDESDDDNVVTENDATQAFGENTSLTLAMSLNETDKHNDSTLVIADEDATIAIEDKTSKLDVDEDATQVFEDATVAVEEPKKKPKDKKSKVIVPVPIDDDATQLFDDATLAIEEPEPQKKTKDKRSKDTVEVPSVDDATQKFEMAEDATLAIEETKMKPKGKNSEVTVEVNSDDDATQVFENAEDETLAVEEPERKSVDNMSKGNSTPDDFQTADDDDATQIFQTTEDATLAIHEPQKKTRGRKPKMNTQSLAIKDTGQKFDHKDIPPDDDATQVYKTEDETLSIEKIEDKDENQSTAVNDEDATQIYKTDIDVTFVVEESAENHEDQPNNNIPADEDATQIYGVDDATVEEEPKKKSKEMVKKPRGRPKTKLIADKDQGGSQKESNKTTKNKTVDKETVVTTATIDISQNQAKETSGRKRLRKTRTTLANEDKAEKQDTDLQESAQKGKQSKTRKSDAVSSQMKVSTGAVDDSDGSTLPLDSEDLNSETLASTDNLEATQIYADDGEVSVKLGSKSKRQTRRQTTGAVMVVSSTRAGSRRSVPVKGAVSKKDGKQNKKVDVDLLEATQAYGMDDEDTSDIDTDTKDPEQFPLKSALASPNKERSPSPSPKRVAFKMQKSLENEKMEMVISPRGCKRKLTEAVKKDKSKNTKDEIVKEKTEPRKSRRGNNQTDQSFQKSVMDKAKNPNISVINYRLKDVEDSDDDLNTSGFSQKKRKPVATRDLELVGTKDSVQNKDLDVSSDSVSTEVPSLSFQVKERGRRGRPRAEPVDKTEVAKVDSQDSKKGAKRLKATDDQAPEVPLSKRVSRRSAAANDVKTKRAESDNITEVAKKDSQNKKDTKSLKAGDAVPEVSTSKRVGRRSVASNDVPTKSIAKESAKSRSTDKKDNKSEQTEETIVDKKLSKRQKKAAENIKSKTNDTESKDNHLEENTSQNDEISTSTRSRRRGKTIEAQTVEKPVIESKASKKRKAVSDIGDNGELKLKQIKIEEFTSTSPDAASPVSKAKGKSQRLSVEAEVEEQGKQLPAGEAEGEGKLLSTEAKSKGKVKQSAEVTDEVQTRRTSRASLATSTVSSDSKAKRGQKIRHVSGPEAVKTEEIEKSQNANIKRRGGQADSQTSEASSKPAKKSKSLAAPTTPSNKKSPKSASANIASPTLRRTSLAPKPRVMFTGVVDEQGEKTVKDLGGELGTSLEDCTHLVTDKVRRTVKFLSCLARGLPIANPQWLTSCKAAGTFIDCSKFLVSDSAAEKQYKFSLTRSIEHASHMQMLTNYKIHVTKSVRPDPSQMKDILHCAGAQYVAGMPKKQEEKLIVISCQEDKAACEPALRAGIPVVNAEFILTGILKQELNVNNYRLFADGKTETGGTRSKGRKR